MTPRVPKLRTRLGASLVLALLGTFGSGATSSPAAAEPTDNSWFLAGRDAVARAASRHPAQRARNVILFVGDGMGVSTVTAARILEAQLRGETGEENLLSFERLPHLALSKTYTTDLQVPDSAATMTAMTTGVKTRGFMLGVDDRVLPADHRSVAWSRVPTLFEQAESRGIATGIVTTASVTHATPAACYAHAPLRHWENDSLLTPQARKDGFPDIARQLLEFSFGDGPEVVLGGGRIHFLPRSHPDPEEPVWLGARLDSRNLPAEWLDRYESSAYVWNREQFDAIDPSKTDHLLGLFEPEHMLYETERSGDIAGEPSLSEMTALALERLSRSESGFLLMVEGGRIDHGHHAGNAHRALTETIEFSRAVDVALRRTDPAETLVVVTADHSHTLTISGYPVRGNDILGPVRSLDPRTGQPSGIASRDMLGRPYSTLAYTNGPGYPGASNSQAEGAKRYPHRPLRSDAPRAGRPDLSEVDVSDPDHLQEAMVPLYSETHGGEDVAIYAGGPGAALFHGVQEQNYIYHALVEALGWNDSDARPVTAQGAVSPPDPERGRARTSDRSPRDG